MKILSFAQTEDVEESDDTEEKKQNGELKEIEENTEEEEDHNLKDQVMFYSSLCLLLIKL